MQIDLYRDWAEILKAELVSFGYDTNQLNSERDIGITFFNLTKRLVEPKPRAVLKSNGFTCPDNLKAGLAEVERKIIAGERLYPHLSKRLRDLAYADPMLNDWGIHHLHLGLVVDPSGFTDRTGPLLFARFDNNNAYLLGVYGHGQWSDQSLIQLLHENWPDSIMHKKVHGLSGIKLSDADIATLRKKNANAQITLSDGTIYGAIGGGYTTNGTSLEAVMLSDRYAMRIKEIQKSVSDSKAYIAEQAKASGIVIPDQPIYKLKIVDGAFYVSEESVGLDIHCGNVNP